MKQVLKIFFRQSLMTNLVVCKLFKLFLILSCFIPLFHREPAMAMSDEERVELTRQFSEALMNKRMDVFISQHGVLNAVALTICYEAFVLNQQGKKSMLSGNLEHKHEYMLDVRKLFNVRYSKGLGDHRGQELKFVNVGIYKARNELCPYFKDY